MHDKMSVWVSVCLCQFRLSYFNGGIKDKYVLKNWRFSADNKHYNTTTVLTF